MREVRRLIATCPRELDEDYTDFVISNTWVSRFLDRFNLSVRKASHRAQQNLKTREEITKELVKRLIQLNILCQNFPPQYILNMDETPVCIDMSADTTIDQTGKK